METFPNSLNSLAQGSMDLVQDMLTQVMKKHPEAKWFHIGADEVGDIYSLRIIENSHISRKKVNNTMRVTYYFLM